MEAFDKYRTRYFKLECTKPDTNRSVSVSSTSLRNTGNFLLLSWNNSVETAKSGFPSGYNFKGSWYWLDEKFGYFTLSYCPWE